MNVMNSPITLHTLRQQQQKGEKISCIALYDAAMAAIAGANGIDILLVGDSLGMTVQGHDNTLPVTLEQMVYHTQAVKRGNSHAFIIADLPFMTYATIGQAINSASQLMQAGASMVKLEGGQWLTETVHQLTERGIPICAHLGLTPQSVHRLGGYRVQGRETKAAHALVQDVKALEAAGADCLVLECIPVSLTEVVIANTGLITIGIGAGQTTDAQVLVINDLLGITSKLPKFAKNFLAGSDSIATAIRNYSEAVKKGLFPESCHCFE